jgi:hypothetical protein
MKAAKQFDMRKAETLLKAGVSVNCRDKVRVCVCVCVCDGCTCKYVSMCVYIQISPIECV